MARASRSRAPSYGSALPSPSNHFSAEKQSLVIHKASIVVGERHTREARNAVLLTERPALAIRINLGNDDLILLVCESIRELLVGRREVLQGTNKMISKWI